MTNLVLQHYLSFSLNKCSTVILSQMPWLLRSEAKPPFTLVSTSPSLSGSTLSSMQTRLEASKHKLMSRLEILYMYACSYIYALTFSILVCFHVQICNRQLNFEIDLWRECIHDRLV